MHKFAMLTMLAMYLVLPTNALRWFQEMWSRPRVNEILYLLITLTNLALENSSYFVC